MESQQSTMHRCACGAVFPDERSWKHHRESLTPPGPGSVIEWVYMEHRAIAGDGPLRIGQLSREFYADRKRQGRKVPN